MFIPLRTDRPPKRRPVVTETLIISNMLVYLAGVAGSALGWFSLDSFVGAGHFQLGEFRAWQLVTYQFLHDPSGIWHLAFNMVFLWVFGCAVEDRLGRIGFLGFYLIGGAVAGLAHGMLHPHAPVIGASGSIAAVTGAFLALFPRSRIKVLVFFFVIGVYSIPSLWFIGFYFAIDLLRQSGSLLGLSGERVAYMAHLAGYLYGFAMGFTLLATGLLKHEEYDVFFLFKQSRRRAAFRAASRDKTGGLWETSSRTESGRLPSRRQTREADRPLSPHQQRLAEARAAINGHLDRHDVETAAALYADLLDEAPEVVLTEPRQLDVANQLYARDDARRAAIAYERLLASYPASPHATEVRLLLGLIYARRLARPDRARELVEAARARLHDPEQRSLAEQLLAELAT